jgi:hypothetical protein
VGEQQAYTLRVECSIHSEATILFLLESLMALNLSSIFKPQEIIVPILNNQFVYNKKKYRVKSEIDGWFRIQIENNTATIIEQHYTQEGIDKHITTVLSSASLM